jgi:DNA replication protein DnaC
MVNTPLDQPEPITFACKLCGKPLKACFFWVFDRWLHPTVHDRCAENWSKAEKAKLEKPQENFIPDRFKNFDPELANARALAAAQAFTPDSPLHTLALIGVRARGKSRIMWAIVEQFFRIMELESGARRWVDYYLFPDLVTEHDRSVHARVKMGRYVFIDDIGSTECYGKERSTLQDLIRTRVQRGQWTFLTIDSIDFDPDFKGLFRGRAVDVWIGE